MSYKEDRTTTYHEVPEENEEVPEAYDDAEYRSDTYQDQNFREDEKFEELADEHYNEEEVFQEEESNEIQKFVPEQPKLTPRQRWHRAYNKIVMQLNVSTLLIIGDEFSFLFHVTTSLVYFKKYKFFLFILFLPYVNFCFWFFLILVLIYFFIFIIFIFLFFDTKDDYIYLVYNLPEFIVTLLY